MSNGLFKVKSLFFIISIFIVTIFHATPELNDRIQIAYPQLYPLLTNTSFTVLKNSKTTSHITLEKKPPIEIIEAEVPLETINEVLKPIYITGTLLSKEATNLEQALDDKKRLDFFISILLSNENLKRRNKDLDLQVTKTIHRDGTIVHIFSLKTELKQPVVGKFLYYPSEQRLFFKPGKFKKEQ